MSQQYPQQPYPPQQPGWGAPPPPPKKRSVGKIVGLGCAGVIGLFLVIGIIGAVASSGGNKDSSDTSAAASASNGEQPAADTKPSKAAKSEPKTQAPKKKTVVFKVWGTAPAGALGPLDITYGSDSDNRKGKFKNGAFEATLPLDDDALYYTVNAQLQGSGDINCSVTVDGHTEKGHAAGGYTICSAQANAGLLDGWG